MTNHSGTVCCLYYEAATGEIHSLNSVGMVPHDLPAFKPVPGIGRYSLPGHEPIACLPGFMPGIKAMYERFGTRPWASLCEEAIHWAGHGHPVSNFEYRCYVQTHDFHTYFPESQELFLPNGLLPVVGERYGNPDLAATLERVSREGPDELITGQWSRDFVSLANDMGWNITPAHLAARSRSGARPRATGSAATRSSSSRRRSARRCSARPCSACSSISKAPTAPPIRRRPSMPWRMRCASASRSAASSTIPMCSACRSTCCWTPNIIACSAAW